MRKYPKKIYLQIETEEGDRIAPNRMTEFGATWSEDRINKSDLVYYRRVK